MRRTALVGTGGLIAVAAVALLGVWFFVLRGDDPPPPSVESALSGAGATPASASPSVTAAAPSTANAALAGNWQVATGESTFLGYRVKEVLARIGEGTAVGRTPDVTGSLTFDGKAVTAVEIAGNTQTLKSDDNRRDQYLARNALETSRFPTAKFTLAAPIAIDRVPGEGETMTFQATGDLTLHGVTKRVTLPIQGARRGDTIVLAGSMEILFPDYGIPKPSAPAVLSVDEKGVMEFQLVLKKAA